MPAAGSIEAEPSGGVHGTTKRRDWPGLQIDWMGSVAVANTAAKVTQLCRSAGSALQNDW